VEIMASEKHALVTGGSSGIGAAICRSLLEDGYQVISLSRKVSGKSVPGFHEMEVDLADALATREAAHEMASRFPITTLIHNAGAIRTMKQRHFGRVVLVSSRAVLGLAKRTVYSSTKAGMLGLARTWALELGVHGITVNVVAPGPIEATEMFHELIPSASPKLPRIIESIPVKRLGRPEDVARAVRFFAAPESGFITGQTLFVCGGTSVGSIVY
jgi:3-oxoacyl-[acyl-carrier protein] reductase